MQNAVNVLEKILRYLEPLLPIANCHMVDFFTEDLYEKHIPKEIRRELQNSNVDALKAFWDPTKQLPKLYDFINATKSFTLPHFPVCLDLNTFESMLIDSGCKTLSGLRSETFMTPKKSHEVEILSKIASAVSELSNNRHIIDIGDGKGYLSSTLAAHSNLNVLGVDSSMTNTVGAAKRIEKMNKTLRRKQNFRDYKRTTRFVTETTDLKRLVSEHFPDADNFGLVGLHTCGDLAASCLKIYASNDDVTSMCNVGCCYHLITTFPLSRYLKERNFTLDRNARMVAAQSLDRMVHRKEKPSDILFYRSLFQVYLVRNAPELLERQAGRFKKPTNFVNYVRKNLKKFGSTLAPSDGELMELYHAYSSVDLQAFYLFRAHLAPVIESVVLLDKLLYLYENGYEKSYLVRLFDPVVSPRCYGLISLK